MKRNKIIISLTALLTFGALTAAAACHFHSKSGEHCTPHHCGFATNVDKNPIEELP